MSDRVLNTMNKESTYPAALMKVVLVVAFSSLARILGGRFDDSFPACAFLFCFVVLSRDQLEHPQFHFMKVRISPQCVSELRRLWLSFPDELRVSSFSLIGAHTMSGQHSQPTPTSSGQRCMRG